MNILVYPTYFPNIAHFVAMLQSDTICFELCDNYQKQTYRNRCSIYGANGRLDLNIPVHHSHKNRQLSRDIKIVDSENWQTQHLKSLHSAYSRSPFYEFFIDEIEPLFLQKTNYLIDFNMKCLEVIFDCIQIAFDYETTEEFKKRLENQKDGRMLANARKELKQDFKPYTQVFSTNHGFKTNLSILDLLFNEGTNTLSYLKSQTVNLK